MSSVEFSLDVLIEELCRARGRTVLRVCKHTSVPMAPAMAGDELKERKKVAFLFLLVRPRAPSSVLAPSSKARSP